MYKLNPLLAVDSYKLGHMTMYPEGTTKVYCNLTPRTSKRLSDELPKKFYDGKIVVYGISGAIQEIVELFDSEFFSLPLHIVLDAFHTAVLPFIGDNPVDTLLQNIEKLHNLGYLPLTIKSLPEGVRIKPGISMMTITNTHPDFAWLPNYLETFISSQVWKLATAATIADVYKRIFKHYANLTGVDEEFCNFQGHDFSSRGMSGIIDAARTGAAHLTSFTGSDSVSSVEYVKQYYQPDGFVAGSVPATEHSVMCLGGKDTEVQTFSRLFELYPKGIVAIVSDTWDYWHTITEIAAELKPQIMSRKKDSLGFCKTVFRPDSGNPVDVLVGSHIMTYDEAEELRISDFDDPKFDNFIVYNEETKEYCTGELAYYGDGSSYKSYDHGISTIGPRFSELLPEHKGSVQCLWDIFGGTTTPKGYRVLDEHVGLIYGDSITPSRAVDILQGLADKGFASSNIVLGIGSYTYQYITRDSLGFAIKATYAEINGNSVQIFKQPKTDSSKTSAKGMLRVDLVDGDYVLTDGLTDDSGGELNVIFQNGNFVDLPTLNEIRGRLDATN